MRRRGGRLLRWLLWDLFAFAVVLAIGLYLVLGHEDHKLDGDKFEATEWSLRSYLWYLKSLYGVLCMPWVALKLPLMFTFILHAKVRRDAKRSDATRYAVLHRCSRIPY